jgi:hypothetical protein
MWAIDRDQRAFAHLDAPQESLSLPFTYQVGWLTVPRGSLHPDHPVWRFTGEVPTDRTGVQIGGSARARCDRLRYGPEPFGAHY